MSVSLPNGAIVSIASGYASPVTVTALSNASPAVATATNTFVAGDFVEVTSGWSRLNNKIVRVLSPTSPSFSMEGIDTTLTSIYTPLAGIGSVRKITGWTPLQQILSSSSSGGEQQFKEFQFLDSDSMRKIPTVKGAAGMTISVADDPALAGYILASAANDDRIQRAVKIVLPNGGVILYNAYVTLNKTPSMAVNDLMAVEVTLSFIAEVHRYAS